MQQSFITTYKQLQQWRPSSLRDKARHAALSALVWKDKLEQAEKYLSRPRIQFLYIHHVFSDEEKALERLLARLAEQHSFISYSDAVSKILTGTIDRPYVCFSSDDGVKNNLAAAKILNDFGASACFFINPALIGETDYQKLQAHCINTLDFPVVEFLNWKEVGQLQALGHEIGGHTMQHINIANTPTSAIVQDMALTREELLKHCGEAKHFAYPFGRFFHFSNAGRKAVFESGYTSCASAERGCHINPPHPLRNDELCIRRDNTVLAWPLDHIMHFMMNNSRNASPNNNLFPAGL
jgi:peptidoglycan/xylan/chitin deacetylase (PgdA/CDA1 family)